MKKFLLIPAGILLCSFILLPPKGIKTSKEKVLEQMTKSNDYLMKRWQGFLKALMIKLTLTLRWGNLFLRVKYMKN